MKSYNNIHDCPIIIFDKVQRTRDYSLVGGSENWEKIYDEYLNKFGTSDNYKAYIISLCSEQLHQIEAQLTGEKIHLTLSDLAKLESEAIKNQFTAGEDIAETAARISQKMGFRVDIKEVSVSEFYNYIKI